MPLLLGPVLAWLGGVAARFLTDTLLKFVAYKLFAITLITVTLPIVLKNVITWLFEQLSSIASTNTDFSALHETTVHLTGYAAYLASHLLLPDCISIILTAVAIRVVLNFIPFIG